MGDAVVEGVACYLAAALIGVYAAEVVPEPEAYLWQQNSAAATLSYFMPLS